MNIIKEIRFNYLPPVMETYNGGGRIDAFPEEYETAIVGKEGVLKIIEHRAVGEGDKWYYDIIYKDKKIRTFRPFYVVFE